MDDGAVGQRPVATSRPARLAPGLFLACLASAPLARAEFQTGTYCSQDQLSRFSGGWPKQLDTSLYWFGPDDAISKAGSGEKPSFYDPTKKTVIYFHGWTGGGSGWTAICKRVTTRCPLGICPEPGGQMLVDAWLKDGWNVGFFYWDQFSDEDCTRDAEQKIWFDRKGDGFRWKSYDVSTNVATYEVYKGDIVSVTDLCVRAMQQGLSDYAGPHVRFVGHSIGAQLAARCAAALHSENHPAAPHRLALLEPYFSKHHLFLFRCKELSTDSGIGEFTAAATADYVKSLWNTKKVITEIYKSSVFTELSEFGVPNEELERVAVVVQYEPDWCGGLGPIASADLGHLRCRHCAVFPMYFLSYGRQPPPIVPALPSMGQPGSALTTCSTPIASCSDGQMLEWLQRQLYLGGGQRWLQGTGAATLDESDDSFQLRPEIAPVANQLAGTSSDLVVELPAATESGHQSMWASLHQELMKPPVMGAVLGAIALLALGAGCLHRGSRRDDEDASNVRSLVYDSRQGSESEDEEKP